MICSRIYLLTLFILITITACGGGGGGGSDSPASPIDGRDESMLEEAAATFFYGLSSTEGVIQLAQSGVKRSLDAQAQSVGSYTTEPCLTGSTVVTHIDEDSDLKISSGDQFIQESIDCDSAILHGVSLGVVVVQIESFSTQSDGTLRAEVAIDYRPGFQIISDDEFIFISGGLRVNYELSDANEEIISIYSVGDNVLEISSEGLIEKFINFEIVKISPQNSFYSGTDVEIAAHIEVESDVLASTFNCAAEDIRFIKGQSSSINSLSDFKCQGDFGEVRLEGSDVIEISLPNEPSFIETYTFYAGDIFEGAISSPAFFDLEDFSY